MDQGSHVSRHIYRYLMDLVPENQLLLGHDQFINPVHKPCSRGPDKVINR